jgi:hypothetical protein
MLIYTMIRIGKEYSEIIAKLRSAFYMFVKKNIPSPCKVGEGIFFYRN